MEALAIGRPTTGNAGVLRPTAEHGADVGDRFVSLNYTAELSGANPFEYLVALLRHASAVAPAGSLDALELH